VEKYRYLSFATETAFEYKYQMATETVEWNTSKQVSAKETALWNVYKYSRIFFFFLNWSDFGENGIKEVEWYQGCNGPSLAGYLR